MRVGWLIVVGAVGLLSACGGTSSSSRTSAPSTTASAPTIRVSSAAFAPGGAIPRQYTCDGRDISPPLSWSGVPQGARALGLQIRDPDAPGGNFIHWSVSGIPPTVGGFAAGRVPAGVSQGRNSFGSTGYRGPCPPNGDLAHHYVISVTALAGQSVLATGTLVGTYARR